MSTHLVDCVGEMDIEPAKKLLLMCLADSGDKETRVAVPGFTRMQKWTTRGKSQTLQLLADLISEQLVMRKSAGRRGHAAEYYVLPQGCCLLHGPIAAALVVDTAKASGGSDAKKGSGRSDPRNGSGEPDANSGRSGSGAPDPKRELGSGIGSGKGSGLDRTPSVSPVSPTTTTVEGGTEVEEEDPSDELLGVAARFLGELPGRWAQGPRSARLLSPAVAEALAAGWSTDELEKRLTAGDVDQVRSTRGALAYRLQDLPRPPLRQVQAQVAVCPEHMLTQPCRGCLADQRAGDG